MATIKKHKQIKLIEKIMKIEYNKRILANLWVETF